MSSRSTRMARLACSPATVSERGTPIPQLGQEELRRTGRPVASFQGIQEALCQAGLSSGAWRFSQSALVVVPFVGMLGMMGMSGTMSMGGMMRGGGNMIGMTAVEIVWMLAAALVVGALIVVLVRGVTRT